MRIVVAPQEFKGTLTALQAASAMAEGARRALPDAQVDVVPLSDGGPGLTQALLTAGGGRLQRSRVRDALSRDIDAWWGLLPDGTAVIEMAAAAGLSLVPPEERDPCIATTYGVGQLIAAALDAQSRRIIVGVGGCGPRAGRGPGPLRGRHRA